MTCAAAYTTADTISNFFCHGMGYDADSEPSEEAVNRYIAKGAARINVALMATGMCSCTFNAYAADYLQELNIIAAAIMMICPDCSRNLKAEDRAFWSEWLNGQLELLRSGKLELCAGATAIDYPSVGWAAQSVTDWNHARIIVNARARLR